MVLIKKSMYLPHFLKCRKNNSNGSFLVSYKEDTDLGYKNRRGCLILGSHHRAPLQGPTSGSHPKVLTQGPTLRSYLKVSVPLFRYAVKFTER